MQILNMQPYRSAQECRKREHFDPGESEPKRRHFRNQLQPIKHTKAKHSKANQSKPTNKDKSSQMAAVKIRSLKS